MAKVTNETVLERVDQLAGDRSQTEIMLTYHPQLTEDIMMGPMASLRRQNRRQKQWLDDLTEASGKTVPDPAILVEDRSITGLWSR